MDLIQTLGTIVIVLIITLGINYLLEWYSETKL